MELKIQDLSVSVANKEIIKHFNLDIKPGEIHVLMGPNGVGKSTICKALMKSPGYDITNGKISFDRTDMTHLDTAEISKLGLYYISQNPPAIEGVTNAEMQIKRVKKSIFLLLIKNAMKFVPKSIYQKVFYIVLLMME